MNCGEPIVLDIDAIYNESKSNDNFSRWLNCGGELVLDGSNLMTMKDKSEIWEIAENYRQRYYNQLKVRYEHVDLQDLVQGVGKKIQKKAHLETSRGIIKRDPVVVVTRPLYDFATWYTYAWNDEVVNEARKRFIVIDLGLELATRKNIEEIFSELSPVMYSHIGHGNEMCIIGDKGEKIIDDRNCGILKNCLVHVTACRTTTYLGEEAINKGCVGYIGYSKNFLFVTKFHALDRQMQEIYERLRNKGKITLRDINEIEKTFRLLVVRCLEHNRDSLRLLGDENARIAYASTHSSIHSD